MSASQEKKRRQDVRSSEVDKLEAERTAEQRKKSLKRVRNVVIVVVVVLLIAAIFVINSNLFYTGMPAVTINGTEYTAAQVNYFYRSNYINYVNTQGEYAGMLGMDSSSYLAMLGLDTNKALDEQDYPMEEGKTWHAYFMELTLDSLKQITMLVDEARAEGFTLPQETIDQIDADLANLETYAALQGYANGEQFLAANYGKGVTVDTVREMTQLGKLADLYAQEKADSFTYTDEELDSWYAENQDTYDTLTYRQFYISGAVSSDIEEPTDADTEAAMAVAKEKADEMAARVEDEDSFAQLALEYAAEADKANYEDPDSTLYTAQGGSISSTYSEWLLSADRQSGDVTVAESSNGYYVVMFISRDNNQYPMRVVRHILIEAEADDTGAYTEEAKAAALEKAEEILAEWKAGDATEESFAALAEEYSADAGSNTNGGLYDNIYKGATVDEFDAFCFDESRKSGDTGIVYGETSSYAGYHIMYYVGEGQLYSRYLAENELRNEDYTQWQTAQLENYTIATQFASRFIG